MVEAIRACHDSVWTFQVIDNEKGSELFLEEQRKLQEKMQQRPKR